MAFYNGGKLMDSVYLEEHDCDLILDALYVEIYNDSGDARSEWFDKLVKLYSNVLNAKEAIVNERNKSEGK